MSSEPLVKTATETDGVETNFDVPFDFDLDTDLRVYTIDADQQVTLNILAVHYTVSGGGGGPGVVTMLSPPPPGVILIVRRGPSENLAYDFLDSTDPDDVVAQAAQDRVDIGATFASIAYVDDHINDPVDAHDASAISIVDAGGYYTGIEVEAALQESGAALAAHLADPVDAHDASAISIVDAGGYYTGIEVEAALQEAGLAIASVHPQIMRRSWFI